MTIEIRELHIRAAIGTDPQEEHVGAPAGRSNEQEREMIVSLCVERVMEILAKQKER